MTNTTEYVSAINSTLAQGDSTEHSHRPAMKAWVESFDNELAATNEPKQSESNAPDFDIKKARGHGWLSVGKMELKDIGVQPGLSQIERDSEREAPRTDNGRQLKRYRRAFTNLIFSDNVEFRWYQNGDLKLRAEIGTLVDGQVVPSADGPLQCESLIKAFLTQQPQKIATARALAERLAALAAVIHDVLRQSLASGTASHTTTGLKQAFKDTLVPDLSDDQFADMLAQTIAYGLFAARVQQDNKKTFTRQSAAKDIPKTNPFLRGLFSHITSTSLDDEPYAGIVDDLAQLLNDADMTKVLRNFGQERRDPIVHFYETFLSVYNPELRDIRGVYYTPLPVVEFIVASVDWVLKESFSLSGGIADTSRTDDGEHKVLVLDPATGTGTFLYATVARIRQEFIDKKRTALWSQYVSEHLLPRLFGFELMIAPYAIAHLKLALQLAGKDLPAEERQDIAYDFEKDERVGVYLTNALDPGETHSTLPLGKFISDEANAAAEVKTDKPIMVLIGNPPYQGQSANASTRREFWRKAKGRDQYRTVRTVIGELLQSYYSVDGQPLQETNSKWLQDDYVKFVRLGQSRIETNGHGVLAYVTNHTYLDAPTFRGMRQSLLKTFDDIYVLDLHGSTRRREINPQGGADDNVFDQIQQGVCITVFVKKTDSLEPAKVHYQDLWGSRADKYAWLDSHSVGDVQWVSSTPSAPFYPFRPEDANIRDEWDQAMSLTKIFPVYSTGIVTHRDELVMDTRRDRLTKRISEFCDPKKTDGQIRSEFFGTKPRTTSTGITYLPGDNRDWAMADRRAALIADSDRSKSIKPITHRPFDNRHVLYHRDAVDGMKHEVMRHILAGGNLGLISARSNKSSVQDQFFVTDLMSEVKAGEATTGSVLFPLWLIPDVMPAAGDQQTQMDIADVQVQGPRPNLSEAVATLLKDRLGLVLTDDEDGNLKGTIGPRDVLDYVYAVMHSRSYRLRYANFLRSDYPRIPFTNDLETFRKTCLLGRRLTALHLLAASENLEQGPVTAPTKGNNTVDKLGPSVRWVSDGDESGHLVLNIDGANGGEPQILAGIQEDVWNYRVGGHHVLHKWLAARVGDKLTYDEMIHLVKTVNSIARTIEVQNEIEDVLSSWPLV